MGEYRVHRINFFDYQPQAVHSLAYEASLRRLVVVRSVNRGPIEKSLDRCSSLEVWSLADQCYQEQVWPCLDDQTIECVVWCRKRLFSAGLHGYVHEHDLKHYSVKQAVSANSGAVWCMCVNQSQTGIAVGTEDGCVVLLKVNDDGLEYWKSLDRQESRILSIAWYEAEDFIVTGGIDNIRVWSIPSGHAVQRLTPGRLESLRETLVWSIVICHDFTIVSGDSRGKVCFWNGRQGTQIKSYQSHKADVLALCQTSEGTEVFASGVDPTLMRFRYTSVDANSSVKTWIKSEGISAHSHDVRALAWTGNELVSAGVDCTLLFSFCRDERVKGIRRVMPMPYRALCHVATDAQLILFQHTNHVTLWRLGNTNVSAEEKLSTYPVVQNPVQLLRLRTKGHEQVLCSSLSQDGKWLAYSDLTHTALFRFKMDMNIRDSSIEKKAALHACHHMTFSCDGTKLVLATMQGPILVVDTSTGQTLHQLTIPDDEKTYVHLMSLSADGTYLALADHAKNVFIYNISKLKVCAMLEQQEALATALAFHPQEPILLAVYSNQKIVEYNFKEKDVTAFGEKLRKNLPRLWKKRHHKVVQAFYHPLNPSQIWLRDENVVTVIDKTQRYPDKFEPLIDERKNPASEDREPHAFHQNSQFKFLLHMDVLANNDLCVVEKKPEELFDKLPPVLYLKKFGT